MPRHGRKLPSRFDDRKHPCIESLEPRRLLNAGDLDTSFSGDGLYLSGDALADVGSAVKRQEDGKLVVAGASITNIALLDYAFYVQRFNPDGTLDTGFGAGGRVTTEFTPGSDLANEVLVQADGKIIALGIANGAPGGNPTFAIARYDADGTPDTTFGTGGLVTSDLGPGLDSILGATLQSDGKIVVAGVSSAAGAPDQFTVARYLTDGTLDGSFGVGGVVVTPFSTFASRGAAVAIDADGKIVAVGTALTSAQTSSENFAIARYDADGSLDTTFDADGKATVNFENASDRATSLAIQGDGKLLVAGEASGFTTRAHFGAARLNADGSLDATWAGDGTLRLPLDAQGNRSGVMAVLVHSDGRVLLAGQQFPATGNATDFALVRLTETGEPDPNFWGNGIRMLDFGGNSADQAGDAAFLPGEAIVMVGASNGGTPSRPFDTAIAQFKGGVDFAALRLGTLSVVGTAGDDAIEIARSGQDYVVTRNGVTNTITPAGQPAGAVTLNVLTIGGNDTVNVVDLVRPGTISLGPGDDSVTLSGAGVGTQTLAIDGAHGADTLNVPANLVVPVAFGGGPNPDGPNVVNFTGSDGDDAIDVSNASLAGAGTSVGFSNVHSVNLSTRGGNDVINWANDRAATLDLGDGGDTINFNRGSFFAIVTVSGGAGDDVVRATVGGTGANVMFDPGEGTDTVIYEGRDLVDTVGFSKTEVAGIPIVRFTELESLVVNGNGDDDDISGTVSPNGPRVTINGGAGNDGITVTFETGARATVNGGDGADTLNLAATAADDTLTLGETSIVVNAESVPFTSVEKVSLNGAAGSDTIVYDGSLNLPALDVAGGGGGADVLRLKGGDGADAFTLVNNFRVTHGAKIIGLSGINEISMEDSAGADTIDVQGSIPVKLAPGQELASLTIGADGRVRLLGDERSTLEAGTLSLATEGVLDIGKGRLDIAAADLRATESLVKTARDWEARWQGPGIGTSAAAGLTGLAVMALPGGGVAVRYTYNGDANLDGRINADDYFRIDQGFLAQPADATYAQGDFNFDDRVNADDYFLIDQAFLGQGAPVPAGFAAAATSVVEEAAPRRRAARPPRPERVWSVMSVTRKLSLRRGT